VQGPRQNTSIVDLAIDNPEVVIEAVNALVETTLEVTLSTFKVDPMVLESGKMAAKILKNEMEVAVENFTHSLSQPRGDREGPETPPTPEQRLEELFDVIQDKFDDKYQDAPQTERASMQLKLNENFDLLRDALDRHLDKERGIERREPEIEPEDHPL
jgi:hypothetical protein